MFRYYSIHTDPIRVTVVGEHSEGVLKIAVSRCSNKDNFYRKKGRLIAEGRLAKGKVFAYIPMEECNVPKFVDIATKLANEVKRTKKIY
jgi:hypothetical protein